MVERHSLHAFFPYMEAVGLTLPRNSLDYNLLLKSKLKFRYLNELNLVKVSR